MKYEKLKGQIEKKKNPEITGSLIIGVICRASITPGIKYAFSLVSPIV